MKQLLACSNQETRQYNISCAISFNSYRNTLHSGVFKNILRQVLIIKNKVMKNILQASALIIIAVSAIGAAALSHHKASEVGKHEWEKGFENASLTLGISDSNFIFHLK